MQIGTALSVISAGSEWTLAGDDYQNIQWLSSTPKPTWEEVMAEIVNPTPRPEPTVAEKLASVGLSVDDLKSALGL